MYRLGLLPLVLAVLKTSISIHEYTASTYSKSLNKNVEYWVLKERVGKQQVLISIVLRKISNGNITFYSVWKNQKSPLKRELL